MCKTAYVIDMRKNIYNIQMYEAYLVVRSELELESRCMSEINGCFTVCTT